MPTGLQFDGVAFGDVFDDLRLGVADRPWSAPVEWATTVESNCWLNSRRSLAMRRSASLESFCAAARSWMVLDGFAGVVFEVTQRRVQLFFHLFYFGLLFFAAFGGKLCFFFGRVLLRGLLVSGGRNRLLLVGHAGGRGILLRRGLGCLGGRARLQ